MIMNTLILLLNILLALSHVNDGTHATVCPGPNAINNSIVEDFLTKPVWDARREAANAGSVSVSQITLLTDSSDGSACASFNDMFQDALDEENSPGEKAYNVTYFKAGSLYFIVIFIRQPDNESYIATGVNYMAVYNHNLDLIKAYAF